MSNKNKLHISSYLTGSIFCLEYSKKNFFDKDCFWKKVNSTESYFILRRKADKLEVSKNSKRFLSQLYIVREMKKISYS